MAKLCKNKQNNVDYFIISYDELVKYNQIEDSVCDECLKLLKLKKDEKIILIPILNEAFCYECGIKKVNWLHDYPEDRIIQEGRTNFYINFFKSIKCYEGRLDNE